MVKNLNDENIVLEGGITNSKYIWHTEPNACKTCQELDGTVYYTKEDIPEKPHPNCKCSVEEVPMDKETCDCLEALDTMIIDLENTVSNAEILTYKLEQENEDIEQDISKVEKMIAEADSDLHFLEGEYGKHLPDCENNIDNQYGEIYATKAELQTLLNDLLGLLNPVATILNVVRVFVTNYLELLHEAYVLKQTGMDKYRHSKANCEAAQYGILGSYTATALSDLKEYYDQYTYVHTHKVTLEEAVADSERDQVANRLGRERGRKYPYCPCSILMNDLKPVDKR